MSAKIPALLEMSRQIGNEERGLAILGEGNTSVRLDGSEFAVKASGSRLAELKAEEVTVCRMADVTALLDLKDPSDLEVEKLLMAARRDPGARRPSLEAAFHAWLLGLDGVDYVGHCHPVQANRVLCSPRARDFAERRLFPDEVVYCGPASVFVPYCDPGLALARDIRERVKSFMVHRGFVPRLILLQNHGIIATGKSPKEVLACLAMAEKAAAIFMGAAALGGPNFLTPDHVRRIAERGDESYRKRQLESFGSGGAILA